MAFLAVVLSSLIYFATLFLTKLDGLSRNIVYLDDKRGILATVTGGLLGTFFYDKGTETTEIYVSYRVLGCPSPRS